VDFLLSEHRDVAAAKRFFSKAIRHNRTPRIIIHRLATIDELHQNQGGHGAGASLAGLRDFAATIRTVTEGRNNMPPFGGMFTAGQIRDVAGYVVEVLAGRAAR
jgi:transposase-like protein